jgi:hypothetical protein
MHPSGRLALIKTTLLEMSVYLSICLGLPWMHRALEKIMKSFLWTSMDVIQNGKCTIAWSKAQRPL